MKKKGISGTVAIIILILTVILVAVFFVGYLKNYLGIATNVVNKDYDDKKNLLDIKNIENKPISQEDKIAENEYVNFFEFIKIVNAQSFISKCKLIFSFSDKFPVNYYILFLYNGEMQLRGGSSSENILRRDNTKYIPSGDVSSDFNFNQYFNNYEKYNNPVVITASGGFVVPQNIKNYNLLQAKSIAAVNYNNKWFLTRTNAYIDSNVRFPDCYGVSA